jgi:hypothetical protein
MTTTTAPRDVITQAHELRRRHPTMDAATRLRWARSQAGYAELWSDLEFDANRTARIERDGFTVHVQYSYDDYPDRSWVGEFTDTWQPGAIKHLPGWHAGYDGSEYTQPDPHTYGWFVPTNSAEADRRWFAKAGYARHDAWLTAQRNARRDYDRIEDITFYVLKVTVFRANVELAVEYLGGIDLGDDMRDVDSDEQAVIMATDSIQMALAEAKDAMKAIAAEFVRDATID